MAIERRSIELQKISSNKFWAIQMSDSNHRKWIEDMAKNELIFDWRGIETSPKSHISDISIAVTKFYPKYGNIQLKKLSYGIQNFSKIAEGDGVLGVNGKNEILKYGYVISSKYDEEQNSRLSLKFDWVSARPIKLKEDFFDPDLEIQRLGIRTVNKLDNIVDIFSSEEKYSVEADAESRGPSESTLSFITDDGREQAGTEDTSGSEQLDLVPLFYGTNRNRTGSVLPNDFYGNNAEDLKYGVCAVSIPKKHKRGELERPFILWNLIFGEDTIKHIVLNKVNELSNEDFSSKFNEVLEINPEKDCLIFIHGYNNSFAQGARRAAQLVKDLPFNGLAAYFSWASKGSLWGYGKDDDNVMASIPAFCEYIENILTKTNIEKLHIIAHSMGNVLLTYTLKDLSNKTNLTNKLSIIQQIVLGAPEIEQKTFKGLLLPFIKTIGLRRTLYASDEDLALSFSEKYLRGGLNRIGQAGKNLFVEKDIETIDSTNIKLGLIGHNYLFEAEDVLFDLNDLLLKNTDPQKRKLSSVDHDNGLKSWFFP